MNGRRIDLSATQVIASLLAAVTGAIAASTLGIAGTIIGTAVMSVASTAVASIYKHYIARSRERLRKAAETARGSDRAAAFRGRRGTAGAHAATRTSTTDVVADADNTQVFPAVGAAQHQWQDADRANGVARHDDATRTVGGRLLRLDHGRLGARAAEPRSAGRRRDLRPLGDPARDGRAGPGARVRPDRLPVAV